jgi:G-protein signaling modulator 2
VSQGEHLDDEESFFDLLSRFQSKRMDDQRCSLTIAENKENTNSVPNSNHNNNATASIKPMMPLNNSNAANSKTPSNGKDGKHHTLMVNSPYHQHGLSAGFKN